MKKLTAVVYWIFTIAYMTAIFYISSQKSVELPPLPWGSDKVLHAVAYAVLGVLSYLSFKKSGLNRRVIALSFLLAVIYGITDEFHQSFVSGRNSAVGDVAADAVGAFLGSYAANVISIKK